MKSKECIHKDKPNIVFCDTYIYSQKESKIVSNTLYPYLYLSFEDFIFHNGGYQGSSTLFNRALKNKALTYDAKDMYIHDEIFSLLAHCFGRVFHLDKPLMLYRIHDSNVIAESTVKNIFIKRIKQVLFRNSYVVYKPSHKFKANFFKFFKSDMASQQEKIFYIL